MTFFDRRKFRRQLAEWERLFRPGDSNDFFSGWETAPPFDPEAGSFSVANAWWLAELCRLAYTPDHIEADRRVNRERPLRRLLLAERTRFQEVHSVHRGGNHASIYLYESREGKRATILCFRGSSKLRQWMLNSLFRPHRWKRYPLPASTDACFVHSGFYVQFKRLWPRIAGVLEALPRPWILAGHSLGGAMATLAGPIVRPDAIYTFGAPKVGNEAWIQAAGDCSLYRIMNQRDIIAHLPLLDIRLGERNFSHPLFSLVVDDDGKVTSQRQNEIREPQFDLREMIRELQTPPPWLCDHRIAHYCQKMQRMAKVAAID